MRQSSTAYPPSTPTLPPNRNPVSFMNWLGSGVAILGTYLYSVATDKHKEELAAAKKNKA
jgi:hypothetical protein